MLCAKISEYGFILIARHFLIRQLAEEKSLPSSYLTCPPSHSEPARPAGGLVLESNKLGIQK